MSKRNRKLHWTKCDFNGKNNKVLKFQKFDRKTSKGSKSRVKGNFSFLSQKS